MAQAYDLVVIGAGTGGYVAAIRAAQLGLKTAVVERQKALGGTCLIWGCIPTKALLEHAHASKIVQHATEWGIVLGDATPTLDIAAVHARKDKIVTGLTKGVESLFKKNGIAWIKGTARLAGQGRVVVTGGDDQELIAKHILVATGSSPRSVPGIAIDHKRIITSDEAIDLREVPGSIVILGSGAVGVEFAIDLQPLRQQGDHRRAAAAARAGRGRSGLGGAGALVPQAGHHLADRHEGHQRGRQGRQAWSLEAQLPDGKSADTRGRLPARGDRPRPGHRGPRRREGRARDSEGLREGGRVLSDQRRGHLGSRRRHHLRRGHAAPAAGSRRVGRRDPGGRAPRRPGCRGRSTTTTCPAARTATRRSAASA